MIQYAIEVLSLSAAFSLFYILFLRRHTFHQWNRIYLLAAMLLSIIIPFINVEVANDSILYAATLDEVLFEENIQQASQQFQLTTFIPWLLALVSGFMLLKFIYNLNHLNRLIRNANVKDNVFYSDKIDSPFSFFNSILLPDQKYNSLEEAIIKEHEQIHINQKHSIDLVLIEFTKIFFWWNPFVHFTGRAITAQHEFFVDRKMLANKTNFEMYGNTLIKQSTANYQPKLTNNFNYINIKKRFQMMTQPISSSGQRLNYLFIAPLLFTLLLVFSCTKNTPVADNHDIYQVVEKMPEYPGGQDEMLMFIYKNIKYPAEAKDLGIEGMVVIQFVVEADGTTSSHEILRDIGGGCGEEALRVVQKMEAWTPGEQEGKKVRVEYKLPVRYKLS